jgi:hypothetical protein
LLRREKNNTSSPTQHYHHNHHLTKHHSITTTTTTISPTLTFDQPADIVRPLHQQFQTQLGVHDALDARDALQQQQCVRQLRHAAITQRVDTIQ